MQNIDKIKKAITESQEYTLSCFNYRVGKKQDYLNTIYFLKTDSQIICTNWRKEVEIWNSPVFEKGIKIRTFRPKCEGALGFIEALSSLGIHSYSLSAEAVDLVKLNEEISYGTYGDNAFVLEKGKPVKFFNLNIGKYIVDFSIFLIENGVPIEQVMKRTWGLWVRKHSNGNIIGELIYNKVKIFFYKIEGEYFQTNGLLYDRIGDIFENKKLHPYFPGALSSNEKWEEDKIKHPEIFEELKEIQSIDTRGRNVGKHSHSFFVWGTRLGYISKEEYELMGYDYDKVFDVVTKKYGQSMTELWKDEIPKFVRAEIAFVKQQKLLKALESKAKDLGISLKCPENNLVTFN